MSLANAIELNPLQSAIHAIGGDASPQTLAVAGLVILCLIIVTFLAGMHVERLLDAANRSKAANGLDDERQALDRDRLEVEQLRQTATGASFQSDEALQQLARQLRQLVGIAEGRVRLSSDARRLDEQQSRLEGASRRMAAGIRQLPAPAPHTGQKSNGAIHPANDTAAAG